jgi:hypothetical protein
VSARVSAWRLATLLELAARRERSARADLAVALACEAERGDLRADAAARSAREVEAATAAAERLSSSEPTATSLRDAARHLARRLEESDRAAEALRAAEAALAAARGEVESRQRALAGARGAVEALERHRARWRAGVLRRRDRAEDASADDLVSARPPGGR